MEVQRGRYTISTDPARLQFDVIHDFLANQSYWATGISRETLQKQIDNSTLHFGLYDGDRQIGYAQVLTNYTSFAYLGNVFVLEEYRGQGLSKWLMATIMSHPDLQVIRRWLLATRDAHGLYRQFGFTELAKPETIMEKFDDSAIRQ
ncbi:acetyltransferase (GNAT) family protein [Larkinella arboricola]|uniref:Acetyltransferase (GNAT) family protein n=1 Tax=Larkinella arboricola TaxID=643671 RepID=A0A327WVQ5_LARAB|nr:GNAT family N-acetyltransferase [Larkinella arboricola]RAJ97427.1 acetyltransferase (GNAT) family protein [Larkinella arboricola]